MSELKKLAEKNEELARKIWLAGLGAYGQSFDNIQSGYEKMSDQAREYFDELVSRGEKLEDDTRSTIGSTRQKIKDQADKNKDLFNKQFSDLKDRVSSLDKDDLLEELQSRVGKLSETLNKLVPGSDKKATAKKPAARKTAAKKPAAKKTATKKAAPKKTATRKPAARKTTASKAAPAAATTTATSTEAAS